jgi:hypothetical protein
MSNATQWCSIHIFYHNNHDELLVHCIEPLARLLKAQELVLRLFFLRYWKGGPHIRLRFLVANPKLRDDVLNMVCSRIREYLTLYPSTHALRPEQYREMERLFSTLENQQEVGGKLQPNNSLSIEYYLSELAKYGGSLGVAIAEDLFDASTSCVFRSLQQVGGTYEKKLGQAFVMSLVGTVAFGLPIAELPDFFDWYRCIWERYLVVSTKKSWETVLEKNRSRLEEYAYGILARKTVLSPVACEWGKAMASASNALATHSDEVFDAVQMVSANRETKRWFLIMNYLHTHNNRIGVLTGDEAFIAFLAYRIVETALLHQSFATD